MCLTKGLTFQLISILHVIAGASRTDPFPCKPTPLFRFLDGSCTSSGSSICDAVLGAVDRPLFSNFGVSNTDDPSGQDLPSARHVSNIVFKQNSSHQDPRGLNEFAVHFAQFVANDIVRLAPDEKQPFAISVPKDDPARSTRKKGEIPFFRVIRGPRKPCRNPEGPRFSGELRSRKKRIESGRPLTSVTAALDLSVVYSSSKIRANSLLSGRDGLLKTGDRNLLPLNGNVGKSELENLPPDMADKYFIAGDIRANMHPYLISIHTLFVREHNRIVGVLKTLRSKSSNRELFELARKINVARYQKIVYTSFFRALSGKDLPAYKGHKMNVDPSASILFASVADGIASSMTNDGVMRIGPKKKMLERLSGFRMIFLPAKDFTKFGLSSFLRGSFLSRAQKHDVHVVDALRDGFQSSLGTDKVASQLQRARDTAIPTFNKVRAKFGLLQARSFRDICANEDCIQKLTDAYGNVKKLEAVTGLLAEYLDGGSIGPTTAKIWEAELIRIRDGDRLFFERKGVFTERELKWKIVQEIFSSDDLLRDIVLRNSDVKDEELPKQLFFSG